MSDRKRDLTNMAAQLRSTADQLEAAAVEDAAAGEVARATAVDQLRAHVATLEGPDLAVNEPPVESPAE